jgi:hypothetical protein
MDDEWWDKRPDDKIGARFNWVIDERELEWVRDDYIETPEGLELLLVNLEEMIEQIRKFDHTVPKHIVQLANRTYHELQYYYFRTQFNKDEE